MNLSLRPRRRSEGERRSAAKRVTSFLVEVVKLRSESELDVNGWSKISLVGEVMLPASRKRFTGAMETLDRTKNGGKARRYSESSDFSGETS